MPTGKNEIKTDKELGLDSVVVARQENQAQLARVHGNAALSAPTTHLFEALKKAGVDRAGAVVVTFEDDGENMLAVMSAKKLNPAVRVVTVVNDQELADAARAAQADVVVAPSEIVGQVLAVSTVSREIAGTFVSGKLQKRGIAEFEVDKPNITIAEVERTAPVLLIVRNGRLLSNVGKEFRLEKGDTLFALTDHESITALRDMLVEKKD